jgi:hypothetical protein
VTNTRRSDELSTEALDLDVAPMPPPFRFPRRKFLTSGILAVGALAAGGVGASTAAAFLRTGTDRLLIRVTTDEIPFRLEFPTERGRRRFLVVRFPVALVPKAEARFPESILVGMRQGATAFAMRCPRDGKRLGWWQSSGWSMCLDCGSTFDTIGEIRGGPSPRGLDLVALRRGSSTTWEIRPDSITRGLSHSQRLVPETIPFEYGNGKGEWWEGLGSGPTLVTNFELE